MNTSQQMSSKEKLLTVIILNKTNANHLSYFLDTAKLHLPLASSAFDFSNDISNMDLETLHFKPALYTDHI